MNRITTYIKESLEELNKVRWPTRAQAIRLSVVVTVFTVTSSLFFGVIDVGLSQAMKAFLNSFF